KASSGSSQQL
ncbi:hypothetical protein BIW11_04186, partial [Tropilaelaps mercedesae]